MKLYTYDHCPFCTRARMIFGFKNIPLDNIFLANDDEATPIGLIGKKMLPILIKNDGSAMAESLDIVHYVDSLDGSPALSKQSHQHSEAITQWLNSVSNHTYHLVWPRCTQIGLAEFASADAIHYFETKKSSIIGPFNEHLANSSQYIAQLNQDLRGLSELLPQPTAALSEATIVLFPVLRNLSMVKGIIWPQTVSSYMQTISEKSAIDLWWNRAL